ncbi:hypothetical protein WMY93_009859 [Mugilogobius chulae]|uniref:Uncharacterized protein n=1 Tax=Mugilogobius chulae TaxID=88201 RepID=A0AAW0P659_9GOBI
MTFQREQTYHGNYELRVKSSPGETSERQHQDKYQEQDQDQQQHNNLPGNTGPHLRSFLLQYQQDKYQEQDQDQHRDQQHNNLPGNTDPPPEELCTYNTNKTSTRTGTSSSITTLPETLVPHPRSFLLQYQQDKYQEQDQDQHQDSIWTGETLPHLPPLTARRCATGAGVEYDRVKSVYYCCCGVEEYLCHREAPLTSRYTPERNSGTITPTTTVTLSKSTCLTWL